MRTPFLLLVAVLLIAIALTGCTRSVADVAEARDECHAVGGVFTSWYTTEFGYGWECDLSDPKEGNERW